MLNWCQTNWAGLALSRSDQHLLALSAMCGDQRGDRLWINARVTQWEGDHGCRSCDLTERISGHCGELRRGGGATQGWGHFARGKARNKDRMCAARPGGLDQSRKLRACDPRGRWGA